MREIDKKRKQSSGEPSGVGLFAKKSRTSSKVTELEIKVIAGSGHTFFYIKGDGEDKLYVCGWNKYGQLGLGDTTDRGQWTEVTSPKEFTIEEVVAGDDHAFLKGKDVNGEDTLYALGFNRYGQLGLGDTTDRDQWTELTMSNGFTIEEAIAGLHHNFLKGKGKDGEDKLYACGWNKYGQLGLGDRRNRYKWTEVPSPKEFTIEEVISGYTHSFLKGKGKNGQDILYACGRNDSGQLGLGAERNRQKWTRVPFPNGFTIEKVMAGGYHSFLKGKGKDGEDKLYACGNNYNGQLGLGRDNEDRTQFTEAPLPEGFNIEKVIAGENHSFLKGKGERGEDKLYACGWNRCGELGLGDTTDRGQWTEVTSPQGFSLEKVIPGLYHSFLKGKGKDGEDTLYATGDNSAGQLGLGDRRRRNKWTEVPVADLLKKLQEDVNDRKQEGGVSEASGSSGFSMGLNPRDCMF